MKRRSGTVDALSADQGATFAENSLGCCYRDGEGTEVDLDKARYWFERAAAKGHTLAENSLGCCYLDGTGTEVDLGKAGYWFERAAAKGYEKAIENLADLDARV